MTGNSLKSAIVDGFYEFSKNVLSDRFVRDKMIVPDSFLFALSLDQNACENKKEFKIVKMKCCSRERIEKKKKSV